MKNLFLFLALLFVNSTYCQEDIGVEISLKNKTFIYAKSLLFKTDSSLYFNIEGDVNFYKIQMSKILSIEGSLDSYNSDRVGDFLMKFAKQSNTGYTLMLTGTLASAILPFIIINIPVLVLPPLVGLTGLIVLANSHKHLKRYSIIESALEFKTLN